MSSEQRLDRLERMLLLVVKAGARERKAIRKGMGETREGLKETDDKINALIDAQMRHEEAYAQSKRRTDEAMAELARAQANTEEALAQFAGRTEEEMARLARAQAETAQSLKALIDTVDRIAKERGNGQD
jgi:hypothetical protein